MQIVADTIKAEMLAAHEISRSWRVVGREIGRSGAYALRLVRGDIAMSEDTITRWIAARDHVGIVRREISLPEDHDALVHLVANGRGAVRVHHVPEGAEVVIVPAGARVVQPKPQPSKPARKRNSMEVTRWLNMGMTRPQMAEALNRAAADMQTLQEQDNAPAAETCSVCAGSGQDRSEFEGLITAEEVRELVRARVGQRGGKILKKSPIEQN